MREAMLNHWVVRLVLALFFQCFRAVWEFKEKLLNPEEKTGARVYDIVCRFSYDKLSMPNSVSSFCLSYKRSEPLSAVLDENVYLYCYNSREVVFIVVEPGKEIWRAKYGSFYKIAQHDYAKQIIIISLHDFFSVCKELPDPGSKLNFVHFVPRSGSTLLIQMFEETGQCISVSEPDEFIPDPSLFKDGITHEEKVKLFRAVGKYVARIVNNNDKYKWYFAKVVCWGTVRHYDALQESFPQSKHIFLYRDFSAIFKSTLNTFEHMPFMKLMEAIVKYVPSGSESARQNFIDTCSGYISKEKIDKLKLVWYKHKPNTSLILYSYCASYDFFLNQRHMPAIRYDDLVENRQDNIKRIMEYFELPLDLVNKAMRAMDVDSQVNSPIAKKKIGNFGCGDLEYEAKLLADDFCKLFNIPFLNEDNRHSNTITDPVS